MDILTKSELLKLREGVKPLANTTRRPKNDRRAWQDVESYRDDMELKQLENVGNDFLDFEF